MSFRSFDPYDLIRDFGKEVTLHKLTTDGSYDPATGTVSGSETTDYTAFAYFYNVEVGISGNSELRRGSRRCVISALGLAVAPDDGDSISGLGDKVHITRVTTHYSNGAAVMYTCEVEE
jgi:hypothetical protein